MIEDRHIKLVATGNINQGYNIVLKPTDETLCTWLDANDPLGQGFAGVFLRSWDATDKLLQLFVPFAGYKLWMVLEHGDRIEGVMHLDNFLRLAGHDPEEFDEYDDVEFFDVVHVLETQRKTPTRV